MFCNFDWLSKKWFHHGSTPENCHMFLGHGLDDFGQVFAIATRLGILTGSCDTSCKDSRNFMRRPCSLPELDKKDAKFDSARAMLRVLLRPRRTKDPSVTSSRAIYVPSRSHFLE